jgi:hypothetical protein
LRRAARIDANQAAIVSALEAIGASVQSLAAAGQGVPDILAGYRGRNYLLEVKDSAKPPSARKLTPAQREWHALWRGSVVVVESVEDALGALA